jgi:hypothetical protein
VLKTFETVKMKNNICRNFKHVIPHKNSSMLKMLMICLALVLSSAVMAQKHDGRLDVKYSKEDITKMMKDAPDQYQSLIFDLDKAWYVTDFPKEKAGQSDRSKAIQLNDIENVNILELNIEILDNDYQYFRINGGDRMLVIRSRKHIDMLRNQKNLK